MPNTIKSNAQVMPERISCDVAIVGYGPVGMVLASLLAQRGFNVVALERHRALYPLARAGHYDGETMRVFQELGVAGAVELMAQPLLSLSLVTGDLEVLSSFHIGEGGAGWKESYLSYQPEIERILDARAQELGVRLFRGVNAEKVEQNGDRASVTCRSVDGVDTAPRVVDAAFVIGADGANSFVRSALGIERESLGFDAMDSLVIDFKLDNPDRALDKLPEVLQVLNPDRPQLAGRWQGRNYSRFEFLLLEGEDPVEFAKKENCWELIKMWNLSPADGHIERNVVYHFEATLAPRWRDGRVMFIGDAAHTMPPTMGQGLCSGIRDAANLAWKLDAVFRGTASLDLLDTVFSERSAHVKRLTEMCVGLGELWNTRDPESVHRRDEMLRLGNVPEAPAFPRMGLGLVLPDRFGVEGRPSPQGRVGLGHAGQALNEWRVDRLDQFGGGWKIVTRNPLGEHLFSDAQNKVLEELGVEIAHVSRGPGPDYFVDLDGEYDLWFRKHGVRAFIQRPDKYVFGAVADLKDLPDLVNQLADLLSAAGWKFSEPREILAERLSAGVEEKPFPDVMDVSRADDATVAFFTSFFTAKTKRQIEATQAHFHTSQVHYTDAVLGWQFLDSQQVYGMWKQYMPFWKATAKSYPVQLLGDMESGAVVVMTNTPELFGGELRAIAIVEFADDKIVRWIDYWDGRGFGAVATTKLRLPADQFPSDLGVDSVPSKQSPVLGAAAEQLMAAIATGANSDLSDLLAFDVTLEDFALRAKLRGRAAVSRYLERAAGRLPYQGATLTHVVGNAQGGGFEWTTERDVPRGAAALTLDPDGRIRSLIFCWDGCLLDDDAMKTLSGLVVEPRR